LEFYRNTIFSVLIIASLRKGRFAVRYKANV